MTVRGLEQEAQKIGEESSTTSANGGVEPYSTEGYTNEGIIEENREATIPISELRKVRYEAAKYRKELQSLKAKLE